MANITAIVDPKSNVFCEDGMKDGRIVVGVPRTPDAQLERYSGDPADPIRPATDEERTADDTRRVQRERERIWEITPKADRIRFRAVLWFALGHEPSTDEWALAKERYISIIKRTANGADI